MLAVVIAIALGAVVGLGSYTFVYAKGGSYLGNDPNIPTPATGSNLCALVPGPVSFKPGMGLRSDGCTDAGCCRMPRMSILIVIGFDNEPDAFETPAALVKLRVHNPAGHAITETNLDHFQATSP